jgi:hypothetical protein
MLYCPGRNCKKATRDLLDDKISGQRSDQKSLALITFGIDGSHRGLTIA